MSARTAEKSHNQTMPFKEIKRSDPEGKTCSSCGTKLEQVGGYFARGDGDDEGASNVSWSLPRCPDPSCISRRHG